MDLPLNLLTQLLALVMVHLLLPMRLQNLPTQPRNPLTIPPNLPTVLLNPLMRLLNPPIVLLNPPIMPLNPPIMLLATLTSHLSQVIIMAVNLLPTSTITITTALTRSLSSAGRRLSSSRASSWMKTIRSSGTLRALCPWSPTLEGSRHPATQASGSPEEEAAGN